MEKDPPGGSGSGDGSGGGAGKPRQTFQAGVLKQLKGNAQYMLGVLNEWAGRSGKTQLAQDQMTRFVADISETMRKMQASHRIGPRSYTIWTEFVERWEGGRGSWKTCLPLAKSFVESLKDLDP